MGKLEAAIEIGSTGIRLLVAELTKNGKRNILDSSGHPVSLGRDVFTLGIIKKDTLLQSLLILNKFKEQLQTWGLTPNETTVIATSALREAKNRDPVLDRIMVKTGFIVKVIDGIEENRLMYLAVKETLKNSQFSTSLDLDSIILEVGGGSTEIMLLEKGKIAGAHSLRLGTVIIEQQLKTMMGSINDAKRYVDEFIMNTRSSLNNELNLNKIKQFIAIGNEPLIVAINAGKPISQSLWEISKDSFEKFATEVQNYSQEECVARFKISYTEAQALPISLIAYQMFLNITNVEKIIVPETTIREGIIISKTETNETDIQQEFYTQIITSAINLLNKYSGDINHAQYVRMASVKLFDFLKTELGLENKARVLLEIAAILHDVGTFIRSSDHQLHSKYIIENSEIFGMTKSEIEIVAQISLWHRGAQSMQNDLQFRALPRSERLTILKLTSILRIADSLDRAHTQRIQDFNVAFNDNTMTIVTDGTHQNILEKIAITEKSDLFESVFGYKVIIN